MSPAEIVAETLGAGVDTVIGVKRIKHGLTNESWLVRLRDDACVVRISNTAESALQIDRNSEATILAVVSAAGIGPDVLLCDPARRLLVTRYLGETWTPEDTRRSENIRRLAVLLSQLHRLPIPAGVRHVDLPATVAGYLDTLATHGVRIGLTEPSLRNRATEAARTLQKNSVPRLCHNDVHHLNIVGDHDLRLIDWEYAGVGETSFDLASICVYHAYSAAQRHQLVSAYAVEPTPAMRDRLELACWLFDYVRELWMAVREATDVTS